MNRGQRVNMAKKSKRHTVDFILEKSPETQQQSPASRRLACWAFLDCCDFQRMKQYSARKGAFRILLFGAEMYCFAKPHAQKCTVYTPSCFTFRCAFFVQGERTLLFSLHSILARRFYCPHTRFTLKLSQNAAAHP